MGIIFTAFFCRLHHASMNCKPSVFVPACVRFCLLLKFPFNSSSCTGFQRGFQCMWLFLETFRLHLQSFQTLHADVKAAIFIKHQIKSVYSLPCRCEGSSSICWRSTDCWQEHCECWWMLLAVFTSLQGQGTPGIQSSWYKSTQLDGFQRVKLKKRKKEKLRRQWKSVPNVKIMVHRYCQQCKSYQLPGCTRL